MPAGGNLEGQQCVDFPDEPLPVLISMHSRRYGYIEIDCLVMGFTSSSKIVTGNNLPSKEQASMDAAILPLM